MSRRPWRFRYRLPTAVLLLMLTVPWWPGLDGEVAGVPAWAAFSLLASVVYAAVIAWLLQRHWHDGADDNDRAPALNRQDPD